MELATRYSTTSINEDAWLPVCPARSRRRNTTAMLACIAFQWGMPINLSHSGALRRTVTSFPTPEGTTTGPGPPVALGLRPPVPELPDYLLTGTGSGTEYLRTTVSDKHLEITVFLALFFSVFLSGISDKETNGRQYQSLGASCSSHGGALAVKKDAVSHVDLLEAGVNFLILSGRLSS